MRLAENLGLNGKAACRMIERSVEVAKRIDRDFVEYFLEDLTEPFFDLVQKRCSVLGSEK
ncbi:hypothetical protein J6Z19_03910 [bacterium]|nr:hypothetical protein [bacterium]